MIDPFAARVIADESAIENNYKIALRNRAQTVQVLRTQVISNTWTTNVGVEVPREGQLVGRVSLREPNEHFLEGGKDFYIGTTHHAGDDYEVFSWAAPVACTFFRKSSHHHPLCDEVAGVRVLAHRGDSIVDYQDDVFSEQDSDALFPRRSLTIPRAPTSSREFAATAGMSAAIKPDPTGAPEKLDLQRVIAGQEHPGLTDSISASLGEAAQAPAGGPELRTPELLRRQLAAPKTVAMTSVLATLQSDQYEAITRTIDEDQVLQGHPGTGKTIIAAHRAAYFLNSEAPEEARPRGGRQVLILGPTSEYVRHVQGALRELIDQPDKYVVQSLPALLEDLAGMPESTLPTQSAELQNVSQDLARLVDIALKNAKANVEDDSLSAEDVYSELLWLRHEPPAEGLEGEWAHYLRQLPDDLGELRRKRTREHLALLAYLGVRTSYTPDPAHIIVDEAQDIHPIEWEILGRLGNVGGWTILGDLNQRRTDHTFSSWDDVARLLGIEKQDGSAPIQVLENGYRSTSQIIRFANQLLPSRDRKLHSLQQDGENPLVHRCASARELLSAAVSAALDLRKQLSTGSVAIISVDVDGVRDVLRKQEWKSNPGDLFTWKKDAEELRVLPPDRARGLEFDGVVVLEPASFPENLGRQGVLYTALTRANRLLTVVHHRALPRGMKARP